LRRFAVAAAQRPAIPDAPRDYALTPAGADALARFRRGTGACAHCFRGSGRVAQSASELATLGAETVEAQH